MAVIPNALTASILVAGSSFPASKQLPQIATAVGTSIGAWLPIPANVLSLGVTVGLAGAGVASGKMFFVPAGQVVGGLTAVGLTGPTIQVIAQAVELGTSATLNASAQYLGLSFGVSAGTDATKVALSNPATLISLLLANMAAVGLTGPSQPLLATGLGNGIAALVATGFGFGGVAPVVPAPSPSAGVSTSVVF